MDNVKVLRLSENFEVIYLKREKLPIFYANLLLNKGSVDETGKRGVHNFTLNLMIQGPKDKTPVEFSQEMEGLGLRLRSRSGYTITLLEIDGLSEKFREGLQMVKEILESPAFRSDDFKRLRDQYLTAVFLGFQDPEFIANYFSHLFYFNDAPRLSPSPELGIVKDVLRLKLDEVKSYYDFLRQGLKYTLVVVSNLDIESFADKINVFEDRVEKTYQRPELKFDYKGFEKVYIVDMDIEDAHLRIMHPTVHRKHPLYYAVKVANYIWGGSDFSSRLMKRVRVKEGLSYSVSSTVNFGIPVNGDLIAPYLTVSCETDSEKMRKAYDFIMEEARKVLNEGFYEEELEDAKKFFKGSIPLRVESYAQILTTLTEEVVYGLPFFHWEKEVESVQKLTLEDVNVGALKLLNFEKPFLLIVGKSKELSKQFKDFEQEVIKPHKFLDRLSLITKLLPFSI